MALKAGYAILNEPHVDMRGRSSVWLERRPVTSEVAGSSPVVPANSSLCLLKELRCRSGRTHVETGNLEDMGARVKYWRGNLRYGARRTPTRITQSCTMPALLACPLRRSQRIL